MVALDLQGMSIENTIFHFVPNYHRAPSPSYNQHVTRLEELAKNELVRRINKVMGQGSNCLEMQYQDTTEVSSVSQVIGIMNDISEHVFISKTSALAQKLYEAQTNNRVPDGMLICIYGRTGVSQQQYVALIKAERQSGFNISSINAVEFLSDLFLTEEQRLYKVGLFVRNTLNTPIAPIDISVHVFDQNATHSGTVGLANYFANIFLGCKPMANAARLTELFYDITNDFIITNPIFTDEQKVGLTDSLHTYLRNDQSNVINGQTFAITYFGDPEIGDQFISRLRDENFPPSAVEKDISRIKRRLKTRRLKFNTGVRIIYPSVLLEGEPRDGLLVFENYDAETNYTSLKIKGRIESQ